MSPAYPQPQSFPLAAGALQAVRLGVIVLDAEQRIVLWNRWMEQHAFRSAESVTGKPFSDVFGDKASGRMHTAIEKAISENLPLTAAQISIKTPFPLYASDADAEKDQRIPQAVNIVPLELPEQPRHCLIEIADISASAAREQELREQAKELQSQSYSDGLTGIANRRSFDAHIDDEFQRAKRANSPLALIMIDVDCFKKYNDNYGHLKGDQCLVKIAASLSRLLGRPNDLLARYGGEEFMAILPDTNAYGAMNVAEAMRGDVEALNIEHAFSDVAPHVTISLGVVAQVPDNETAVAHLIGAADRALYRAKNQGRNRVVAYSAPAVADDESEQGGG